MWLYQALDIVNTIAEGFCLYVVSRWLCKEPRFQTTINKFIPPIAEIMLTYALTWFTELGAWKIPLIFIFIVAILKICYKDSIYQSITAVEVWMIVASILMESIAYGVGYLLYGSNQLVMVEGQTFTRWEIYIIGIAARLFVLGVVYLLLKNFKYKMQMKDSIVLTLVFLIAFAIVVFANFNLLNLEKAADVTLYISSGVLAAIFMMIFMYAKNILYLREQEQRDKVQIAQLQQQYAYYSDKLKDEERIRSIYHDLKNHLLVMESRQNTEETRQMAETLRSQIADYENYVHTGNEFLDIILKDKAEKAREKNIDFSAFIDFSGIDFIEPLDISTLFGNGIDNAIEASEKLPEDQRVILVKAGKVQDFVSILIENNCLDEVHKDGHTTKADKFLHGFGISNMKKAAEKYKGTCTITQENGKFTLKILLPISKQ
ncbi:MAG: GHKL domain-containing protein [Eubacterium sp.]